ncbi:MAG: hypothetical protein AB1489_43620 [Acidobacteriota bacterium]
MAAVGREDQGIPFFKKCAFCIFKKGRFKLFHLLVGIILTYDTLAGLFNKSIIVISEKEILIKHKPLWWPGNKMICCEEIDQISSQKIVTNSRSGQHITFNLTTTMKNRDRINLLKNLPKLDIALFIEQQIEKYLGVIDRTLTRDVLE